MRKMKIETENINEFARLIDFARNMNKEPNWEFNNENVVVSSMNTELTGMFIITIPKTFFSIYEVGENEKMCFEIEKIQKIMKNLKNESKIQLEKQENKLIVKQGRSKFKMGLIDKQFENVRRPNIVDITNITFDAQQINEAIKIADVFESGRIIMELENKVLTLKNEDMKNESSVELDVQTDAKIKLGLNRMYFDATIAKAQGEILFGLKTSSPMYVKHKIGEAIYEAYIAPIVEND
jgi:DNA polymerase III sliding clamp (beta) subunit (PCNA family)